MIDIKLLNKAKLQEFIDAPQFNDLPFVPISRHRALSHIANPAAANEDILLLLAYEEEVLVGYLGVLPGFINQHDSLKKCGWLSCMWVDTEHRGKQIAQRLLEACFTAWNKAILVTEFTVPAARLYEKTEVFNNLQIRHGIRLYVRSDMQKLLPPHRKIYAASKILLRAADISINAFADIRFPFLQKNLKGIHLEYIDQLDKETEVFIADRQEKDLFRRNADELNWILKNPWILSAPEEDEISKKYHFSSVEPSFTFYAIKIRDTVNKLIGFMLLSKRNNSLKLPYCYFDTEIETIADILMHHIIKWRINTFTTFHSGLTDHFFNHRTPALFKKEIKRHYIISKVFDIPAEFDIQDGDADSSFT